MPNRLKIVVLLPLLCCLWALNAEAKGIVVESMKVNHVNGLYTLDADIQYELSDVAQEALHRGVSLTFKLTIAVMVPRPLLWDQPIVKEQRRYVLSHQDLTNQYRLQRGDSPLIQNFPTLNSALSEMGSLRGIAVPLFDRAIREDSEYVGIKTWLDIESLPVPMRLLAYIRPGWRHNSGWSRWEPNP